MTIETVKIIYIAGTFFTVGLITGVLGVVLLISLEKRKNKYDNNGWFPQSGER